MDTSIFEGKYKILGCLGSGGMGSVYVAEHIRLGNKWAVKETIKKPESKVDFLAEVNILKNLEHPLLPRIIDIFEDDKAIYIVEDYVEGESLDKYLSINKRAPEKKVLEWAKSLCEGLKYLHNQKPHPIIYRDMKPDNIMLKPDGNIKLIDFGIAREYKKTATNDTIAIGTRGYAAPEQYGASQTDERTDIYSLGVTLYHLVTGLSPNEPPYEIQPIRKIDRNLSYGLEYIISKCTQADPRKRYQSIEELIFDIDRIDTFDAEYKRVRRKKRMRVAIIVFLFISSSSLTATGLVTIHNEALVHYRTLVADATALSGGGRDEEAISLLTEAETQFPETIDAYIEHVLILYGNEDYENCINYIMNNILPSVPDAEENDNILYILGSSYFGQGDYEEASLYLERALTLNPLQMEDCLRDYAVTLARLGKLDEAALQLNRLISNKAAEDITYYVAGEVEYAKKNLVEAENDFLKSISLTKDDKIRKKAYYSLIDLYRKYPHDADPDYGKRIDLIENARTGTAFINDMYLVEALAEAYYLRGEASKSATDYEMAAQLFSKLIDTGYQREYIYSNIYFTYLQLNKLNEAASILKKMAQVFPDSYKPYLFQSMLEIYIQNTYDINNRNYDSANNYYKKAVELYKNEDDQYMRQLEGMINDLKEKNWIERE